MSVATETAFLGIATLNRSICCGALIHDTGKAISSTVRDRSTFVWLDVLDLHLYFHLLPLLLTQFRRF